MINDCAFVGETLLKYFPPDIEKHHIKRSRGVWSKTLGLAYNIIRSEADVYHAHYLLQDCYIAERLRKHPLIGHAHGSDLRVSLNHFAWKRIVRHNLKHCDKVLVSTPDVLTLARAFRADADYLPNPVDTNVFYPKPLVAHDGKMRVLIASSAWIAKGTDIIIHALGELRDNVEASMINYGVDYAQMLALARSRARILDAHEPKRNPAKWQLWFRQRSWYGLYARLYSSKSLSTKLRRYSSLTRFLNSW
jgi:glycosyltransferase involved in cell wall biosynthesis